jgi:glycosyltransferase involved in cell wall biosynthesis
MQPTVLSVGYPLARVSEATAGGAEQVLLTLDKALVREGHRSLVVAPTGSKCHGLLIPVHIPTGTLDDKAKQESRRLFKQAVDAALGHYSVDIVHMHGLDFCDYLPDGRIPVVVTLHMPLNWYKPQDLKSRTETTLICVSQAQARTAPAYAEIDGVITNGVDVRRFQPIDEKGNYILAMGRICPEKGFHLAIDAASQAGEKLIIAGSVFSYPEHQEYFERIIRARLGDSVQFIGAVGSDSKSSLLAGAKCLLVPSLAPETSSLIAMEALASGTPVIAMRSGALQEIISDGETGFLVSSADEMAQAIRRIDLIRPEECHRQAENRFSAEAMITNYLNLYQSIVPASPEPELQAA